MSKRSLQLPVVLTLCAVQPLFAQTQDAPLPPINITPVPTQRSKAAAPTRTPARPAASRPQPAGDAPLPAPIGPIPTPRSQPVRSLNISAPAGKTSISEVTYGGRRAFRLTDGRSEAVVVPSIGRVMRYGLIGGENWLWNAPDKPVDMGGWANYGGDKTWPSPQGEWPKMFGKGSWPPPVEWDGKPHWFKVEGSAAFGSVLHTSSRVAPGGGARIERTYYFEDGDFVAAQRALKVSGAPIDFSIWSIAQVNLPDAIYAPLNPDSPYKNNWRWHIQPAHDVPVRNLSPSLLQLRTLHYTPKESFKLGIDSPVNSLVAVKNGMAWRIRTAHPAGNYPDGLSGAGNPVQLYVSADSRAQYAEMELLGPLRTYRVGSRWQQTVRWNLIPLTHTNVDDEAQFGEVEALLRAP